MITNAQNKVCVISLTYNRPQYIKRSFESLRNRSGISFDHYIFDDGSDKETIDFLNSQKEHFANIHFQNKNMNVSANFYQALKLIPKTYEYYLKFDSDIELLTDDLLKGLVDITELLNIGCVVPRVEGISWGGNADGILNFYKNHCIRIQKSMNHGCCMLIPRIAILNYIRLSEKLKDDDKWGADTKLYQSALLNGEKLILVEDLSVYHIDNTAGQRKDWKYFKDRKRWQRADDSYVDYLRASKDIAPNYVERAIMDNLFEVAGETYESFLSALNEHVKNPDKLMELRKKLKVKDRRIAYRISSPSNYPSDPHITHETEIIVNKVPEWARNNGHVVVEQIELESWEDSI
jgi:glycosyltransferase involved in cell wall biosynthesis